MSSLLDHTVTVLLSNSLVCSLSTSILLFIFLSYLYSSLLLLLFTLNMSHLHHTVPTLLSDLPYAVYLSSFRPFSPSHTLYFYLYHSSPSICLLFWVTRYLLCSLVSLTQFIYLFSAFLSLSYSVLLSLSLFLPKYISLILTTTTPHDSSLPYLLRYLRHPCSFSYSSLPHIHLSTSSTALSGFFSCLFFTGLVSS